MYKEKWFPRSSLAELFLPSINNNNTTNPAPSNQIIITLQQIRSTAEKTTELTPCNATHDEAEVPPRVLLQAEPAFVPLRQSPQASFSKTRKPSSILKTVLIVSAFS
jgi:hypothetical protein